MDNQPYVIVKNLSKKIKGQFILQNIDLTLYRGKIYGFKGRNGSGKTMLFRALCGLIHPTDGEIMIDNQVLGKEISFPESVGVIIEYPGFLPDLTGLKNLKLIAEINHVVSEAQIRESLKAVGLDPDDKRKFKKYSLGMKQRLGIAQALMENPEFIILDEPTNALDTEGLEMVRNLLFQMKKENKLILIASHSQEDLKLLSDEMFTIENGKIINHEHIRGDQE